VTFLEAHPLPEGCYTYSVRDCDAIDQILTVLIRTSWIVRHRVHLA